MPRENKMFSRNPLWEKLATFLLKKYLFAYSNDMRKIAYAKKTCAAFEFTIFIWKNKKRKRLYR